MEITKTKKGERVNFAKPKDLGVALAITNYEGKIVGHMCGSIDVGSPNNCPVCNEDLAYEWDKNKGTLKQAIRRYNMKLKKKGGKRC